MTYRWVIGSIDPSSEQGKSILAHASEGIGYFILNKSRTKGQNIIYGFRRPENSPLPDHLEYATYDQSEKLEIAFAKRNGIMREDRRNMKRSTQAVADIFPGSKHYAISR